MKDLIRLLWRFKIKVMFYFNLGFGEINNIVNLVKNVVIVLAGIAWLFKIAFAPVVVVGICIVFFLACVGLGVILKVTGMSDYANRMTNDVNPEMKLIRKIAKQLNIEE